VCSRREDVKELTSLPMRDTRTLTATSFAILGLLSVRPWRTYDLAKQVPRSLSHFWPRAESNLYAEAKRLVAGGYAVTRIEQTGARQRTVYMITPQGRKALKAWLAKPGGEMRFESEPLLKVFFADQGSKADLLDTIRTIGEAAEQRMMFIRSMAEEYRVGAGPFPERLAVGVLAVGLVWDQLQATVAWSERAALEVERWRTSGPGEAPSWPAGMFSPAQKEPVAQSHIDELKRGPKRQRRVKSER
jgi:DNA-binding PadR family transcriptional regulator